MALSTERSEQAPGAVPASNGAAHRPARRMAARWSPAPTWATLLGWPLLLVGQRILDGEDTLSKILTAIAAGVLVLGVGRSAMEVSRSPGDRRPAVRILAWLSGLGLVALVIYFATTDWGRELLHLPKPGLGKPDAFGDVARRVVDRAVGFERA